MQQRDRTDEHEFAPRDERTIAQPTVALDLQWSSIQREQQRLNTFSHLAAHEQVREQAQRATLRLRSRAPLGPLAGKLLALKASLAVEGMPVTYGSAAFAANVAERDGAVASRLRAAGAILLGLTNMDEFGIGVATSNPLHGQTRHPLSLEHSPGGSSGGSAGAVAAGQCFAAIGVDTAGSLRIPAALCGVVGLMPSAELVPDEGSCPGRTRFDRVGPIARSVADCVSVLDALSGADSETALATTLHTFPGDIRIGVPGVFGTSASSQVAECLRRARRTLSDLGCEDEDSSVPRIDVRPMLSVLAWERYRTLGSLLTDARDLLSPATVAYLSEARRVSDADYELALQRCAEARSQLLDTMQAYDLLLLPTTTAPAPPLTTKNARFLLTNTFPFNLSGQPALTVPCGRVHGLPVGLTLAGRPGATDLLVRVAHAFEQATTAADIRLDSQGTLS